MNSILGHQIKLALAHLKNGLFDRLAPFVVVYVAGNFAGDVVGEEVGRTKPMLVMVPELDFAVFD